MKKVFVLVSLLVAAYSIAQTCIPGPVKPPTPRELIISLPLDGGSQGCTIAARVLNGAPPNSYAVGNAKCATAVQMAQQAAANDNGWNDGGAP